MKITSRFTGAVLFEAASSSITPLVEAAVTARANLMSADLRGADLEGANLRNADLGGADLGGADLGGANLRNADLGGADLVGANLRNADLGGADLRSADLGGADLGDANLRGADLVGASLGDGITLRGAFTLGFIDGWSTMLLATSVGLRVVAGCRNFTLAEAAEHYADRENRTRLYYLATEGWKTIVRLAGWETE